MVSMVPWKMAYFTIMFAMMDLWHKTLEAPINNWIEWSSSPGWVLPMLVKLGNSNYNFPIPYLWLMMELLCWYALKSAEAGNIIWRQLARAKSLMEDSNNPAEVVSCDYLLLLVTSQRIFMRLKLKCMSENGAFLVLFFFRIGGHRVVCYAVLAWELETLMLLNLNDCNLISRHKLRP